MPDNKEKTTKEPWRLRAHHIFCAPALRMDYKERSVEFRQLDKEIKRVLLTEPDTEITLIEGNDALCQTCCWYSARGCVSPKGDEKAVRAWDAILLKELGITYGTGKTAGEWRALAHEKTPFRLCCKCHWQHNCAIGAMSLEPQHDR